jgi:hypothetical protein
VVIRSIYRTIELTEGWTGFLIKHESYFIGLDGVMMVIAVGVFNIVQPRWADGSARECESKRVGSDEEMVERADRE